MSEMTLESPFLTTAELAKFLRKKPQTVRLWRHRGTGPFGTKIGREVIYDRADVDAWLEVQRAGDHIAARSLCGRNRA